MNILNHKTILRCTVFGVAALSSVSCKQGDPAIANELIVISAERERLKGELEKARDENQALQQQLSEAQSGAQEAVSQAKKGIDKNMVERSFLEAVRELQDQVKKKYPSDEVDSYKIYDVNFPSENPISSSVAFTMKDGQGNERTMSFEGAANTEGEWNFASVANIVARTPKVKAPQEKPQETAQTAPDPAAPTGVQRIQPTQKPVANGSVHVIEWPE